MAARNIFDGIYVQYLLTSEVRIPDAFELDARDSLGYTALHLSCSYRLASIVEALVRAGASVNLRNNWGQTPLMYTCGRADIAQILINAGADLEVADTLGRTALHYACDYMDGYELAKLLLRAGCCPNPRTSYRRMPIHLAVMNGAVGATALLLDTAPRCALDTCKDGWNALHYASSSNSIGCMKAIYARCKVIDAVTNDGETALQIAVRYRNTEASNLLRIWVAVPRRLAFLAGSCLNPANLPATTRLASLPIDILRLIVKKV